MDKRKGQGKEQMSKKDTVTKAFMRENTVFADAFNYLIFNGKKVIECQVSDGISKAEELLNRHNGTGAADRKREKQQKRVRSEIPGHFKGCCYYGG